MRKITETLFAAIALSTSNLHAKPPTPFYPTGIYPIGVQRPLSVPGLPFVSSNSGPARGASADARSLPSGDGQNLARGHSRRFGQIDLTHGKNNPNAPGVTTIPHWSDSFTYNGLVYSYT